MKPLVVLVLSLLIAGCSPFDSQDGTPIEPPEIQAWVYCGYGGAYSVSILTASGMQGFDRSDGIVDPMTGLTDTAFVVVEGAVNFVEVRFLVSDPASVLYDSVWCPSAQPLDSLDVTLTFGWHE